DRCAYVAALAIKHAVRVRNVSLHRQRRRGLEFTIQPRAQRVNSFTSGRRATYSWFLHVDLARSRGARRGGRHVLIASTLGTTVATTISSHWRGGFRLLNFAYGFGDD